MQFQAHECQRRRADLEHWQWFPHQVLLQAREKVSIVVRLLLRSWERWYCSPSSATDWATISFSAFRASGPFSLNGWLAFSVFFWRWCPATNQHHFYWRIGPEDLPYVWLWHFFELRHNYVNGGLQGIYVKLKWYSIFLFFKLNRELSEIFLNYVQSSSCFQLWKLFIGILPPSGMASPDNLLTKSVKFTICLLQ